MHESPHDHGHPHDHEHESWAHPGLFRERDRPLHRDFKARAFTVGIGGTGGERQDGAPARALPRAQGHAAARGGHQRHLHPGGRRVPPPQPGPLPANQIRAVETGGCPHAAIREDISHNLMALEQLMEEVSPELLFVESGGDNLAAQYSRELVDYTVYVIDVAGGDKVPRKGGPGITQSDLLVINKVDLAPHVGADLGVMERDARRMRGDGPMVFAQCNRAVGVPEIVGHILAAWGEVARGAGG